MTLTAERDAALQLAEHHAAECQRLRHMLQSEQKRHFAAESHLMASIPATVRQAINEAIDTGEFLAEYRRRKGVFGGVFMPLEAAPAPSLPVSSAEVCVHRCHWCTP